MHLPSFEDGLSWRFVDTGSLLITISLGILLVNYGLRIQKKKQVEAIIIKEQKCQKAPRLNVRWPLGLDLLVGAFSADRKGRLLDFFVSLIEENGINFDQIIFGSRAFGTVDPRNVEAILSTQFRDFSLGLRKDLFRPLIGRGIFTQDAEDWKTSRDMLRPQFMHTRVKSFSNMQETTEKLVKHLVKHTDETIDLQALFFRLTMDTTMLVLFGRSFDSSSDTVKAAEAEDFAHAFNSAQHKLAQRGRFGELYWMLDGVGFRRSCRKVHSFVDEIVLDALNDAKNPAPSSAPEERYVFLKALIENTKDPKVLRDQCVNVLLAGRDTTACLLSWTMYMLVKHPEIQQQLRKECLNIPTYSTGELPTPAELKDMKMLDNVFKEVLRLYPSVPVNARSAVKATSLPFGGGADGQHPVLIRKGDSVGYCVYAMHRRKDLYGPDADEFRPMRWETLSPKDVGMGYLPFNGGPRVCPGQEFASLLAGYTVVRLMQEFSAVEMAKEMPAVERQIITLVLTNADGCKVVLRSAHH